MSKKITPGGKVTEVLPKGEYWSLAELQTHVGGLIEQVTLDDNTVMIINQEGVMLDLPYNHTATEILEKATGVTNFHAVLGNVVVCGISNERYTAK